MRVILIGILFLTMVQPLFSQCDSVKIGYQTQRLKSESHRKENYFTDVHKDSLQINFNDGFGGDSVFVLINGVEKVFISETIESLGFTWSLTFARPSDGENILLKVKEHEFEIKYNSDFNMIYMWFLRCVLIVRHTNWLILYE